MTSPTSFAETKATILERLDASPKGSIDAPIVEEVAFCNTLPDFVTTSSCSGRVSVFGSSSSSVDAEKGGGEVEERSTEVGRKGAGRWLLVEHREVSVEEVETALSDVSGLDEVLVKAEPFILHVRCRTLDAAGFLLRVALAAGFRESGVVLGKSGVMVAVRTTSNSLQIPVVTAGKWVLGDGGIAPIVDAVNARFRANATRTTKFFNALKEEVAKRNPEGKEMEEEERKDGEVSLPPPRPSKASRKAAMVDAKLCDALIRGEASVEWWKGEMRVESTSTPATTVSSLGDASEVDVDLLCRWGHGSVSVDGVVVVLGGNGASKGGRGRDMAVFRIAPAMFGKKGKGCMPQLVTTLLPPNSISSSASSSSSSSTSSTPTPRVHHTLTAIDNHSLLLYGGRSSPSSPSRDVAWILEPHGGDGTWKGCEAVQYTLLEDIGVEEGVGRWGHCAVPITITPSVASKSPFAPHSIAVWIFGNRNPLSTTPSQPILIGKHCETEKWVVWSCAELDDSACVPSPRYSSGACLVGDGKGVLVHGGFRHPTSTTTPPSTSPSTSAFPSSPRHFLHPLGDAWIWEIETQTWFPLSSAPPLASHALVSIASNVAVAVGGSAAHPAALRVWGVEVEKGSDGRWNGEWKVVEGVKKCSPEYGGCEDAGCMHRLTAHTLTLSHSTSSSPPTPSPTLFLTIGGGGLVFSFGAVMAKSWLTDANHLLASIQGSRTPTPHPPSVAEWTVLRSGIRPPTLPHTSSSKEGKASGKSSTSTTTTTSTTTSTPPSTPSTSVVSLVVDRRSAQGIMKELESNSLLPSTPSYQPKLRRATWHREANTVTISTGKGNSETCAVHRVLFDEEKGGGEGEGEGASDLLVEALAVCVFDVDASRFLAILRPLASTPFALLTASPSHTPPGGKGSGGVEKGKKMKGKKVAEEVVRVRDALCEFAIAKGLAGDMDSANRLVERWGPDRFEKIGDFLALPPRCLLHEMWFPDLPPSTLSTFSTLATTTTSHTSPPSLSTPPPPPPSPLSLSSSPSLDPTFGAEVWKVVAKSVGAGRLMRRGRIGDDGGRRATAKVLLDDVGFEGVKPSGWTVVKQHGIEYMLEVTRVMFSKGNAAERGRQGSWDCSGQVVVDLFAGIGYFSIPVLKHGKAEHLHACDWNEDALHCLAENAKRNKVDDRITLHPGDNATAATTLRGVADRVLLGLIPSSESAWPTAAAVLKPTGGWVHVHGNVHTPASTSTSTKDALQAWGKSVAKTFANFRRGQWRARCMQVIKVKSYAPRVFHCVADIVITQIKPGEEGEEEEEEEEVGVGGVEEEKGEEGEKSPSTITPKPKPPSLRPVLSDREERDWVLDEVEGGEATEEWCERVRQLAIPVVVRKGVSMEDCARFSVEAIGSGPEGKKKVSAHVSTHAQLRFKPKRNFSFQVSSLKELCDSLAQTETEAGGGEGGGEGGGAAGSTPPSRTYLYLRAVGSNPRKQRADISRDFPSLRIPHLPPLPVDPLFSSVLRLSSPGLALWTHYDVVDNALVHLSGTKRVLLIPPRASARYLSLSSSSSSPDDQDDGSGPSNLHLRPYIRSVTLNPGDILFLPAMWAHHVLTLPTSKPAVSVNLFWNPNRPEEAPLLNAKDLYGNRDPTQVEEAATAIDRLRTLPPAHQAFYATKLIAQLQDALPEDHP